MPQNRQTSGNIMSKREGLACISMDVQAIATRNHAARAS
jgi:hypothetical protein